MTWCAGTKRRMCYLSNISILGRELQLLALIWTTLPTKAGPAARGPEAGISLVDGKSRARSDRVLLAEPGSARSGLLITAKHADHRGMRRSLSFSEEEKTGQLLWTCCSVTSVTCCLVWVQQGLLYVV